eukprot:scaffold44820_cov65-Phaeocystis_antarctica.AAC.4
MSRPRGACVLTERGSTATWLFIGACHRSMHRYRRRGTVETSSSKNGLYGHRLARCLGRLTTRLRDTLVRCEY